MKKIFWVLVLGFLLVPCSGVFAAGVKNICDGPDFSFEIPNIKENEKARIKIYNKTTQDARVAVILDPTQILAQTQRFCVKVGAGEKVTVDSPQGIVETTAVEAYFHRYTGPESCSPPVSFSGKPYDEHAQLCYPVIFEVSRPPSELGCQITLDKEWYRPGEKPVVTLTNTSPQEAEFSVKLLYPARATPYYYPVGVLKPGETSKKITLEATPSIDKPETARVEGEVHFAGGVFPTICGPKEFKIALSEEDIEEFFEVFRPQECDGGIETALGCFPTEIGPLVSWLFKYGISIAGGIAFLMIIFSAFQMITSSGDPEKLQKAKQMLGSAIAGLVFIIFAVFLLRIIGVEILGIF